MSFDIVYLNGQFLPRSAARISPDDRGFLLGDGVFETLRTYNGHLFCFDAHAKRLYRGLEEARIPAPVEPRVLERILLELLAHIDAPDFVVRITITRGPGSGGYALPKEIHPTIYICARPVPDVKTFRRTGLTLSFSRIPRPLPFQSVVKTISCGAMALARFEADTDEVVMLDSDGFVAEGSASSIFLLQDGRLIAPPQGRLLPGITRLVLAKEGLVDEEPFGMEEMRSAKAVIVASTSTGPLPVSWCRFPDEAVVSYNLAAVSGIVDVFDELVEQECGHRA